MNLNTGMDWASVLNYSSIATNGVKQNHNPFISHTNSTLFFIKHPCVHNCQLQYVTEKHWEAAAYCANWLSQGSWYLATCCQLSPLTLQMSDSIKSKCVIFIQPHHQKQKPIQGSVSVMFYGCVYSAVNLHYSSSWETSSFC